ncbi:serine/threonine-protein kinase [Streptomyces sp. NRRL F-5053]|uniref:serine/threonine-protein kinase n=1 Tax=Streptomyces sp. NRRL F-5053 TaxID=1463854 RepID=UPI0004C6417E|nr:serine/threonine-protein kinase [Streptomyces sp. NRRL F-5053]
MASGDGAVFGQLGDEDPQFVAGYRLTARLGAGGMGKVYLSYTPGGRPVAIKVIRSDFSEDPEFRRRFQREVRAAERVQGLYTAPVIDSDTEAERPWLATAYVPGPSLAAAVSEHGGLPVETVLYLVAGVAEALQVIHGAGIVHRDLKPSNVLLASDGPRVIDFGIARAADATALTGSGAAIGTPCFMAPEQAAAGAVTEATDIFALGQVTAYAALGTPAFGEGASHAVLYRIVHAEPVLDGLPEELSELVTRCLDKDPARRPGVAEVIGMCQRASGQTQLRRPEDWLPVAVAADVTQRAAAPAPPAAVTPPAEAQPPQPTAQAPGAPPTPPPTPPSTPPNTPPATPPSPPTAAPEPPATAPLPGTGGADGTGGTGGTAQQPPGTPPGAPPAGTAPYGDPGAATPTGTLPLGTAAGTPGPAGPPSGTGPAAGGPVPGAFGAPAAPGGPNGPGNGGSSGNGRSSGGDATWKILAGVLGGLLVCALAAVAFLVLPGNDDGDAKAGHGDSADSAGTAGSSGSGDAPDATGESRQDGQKSGGSRRDGAEDADGAEGTSSSPTAPPPDPEPKTYRNINLPSDYTLDLGETPVKPQRDEDANGDLSYTGSDYGIEVDDAGSTQFVLLKPGQDGSLKVCREETRFTDSLDMDKLSKGTQLCVRSDSGNLGLVTVRGHSPDSDPSDYLTLDVTVWHGALEPADAS